MSDLLTPEASCQSGLDEASYHQPAYLVPVRRDDPAAHSEAVILAVASPALLRGLEALVAGTPGMRLAGSVQSMQALFEKFTSTRAGVALIDPYIGGHANLRTLIDAVRGVTPALRCMFITDEYQPHVVREAVKAGVAGFVGASADADEIRTGILQVSRGHRYIAATVAARLAESLTLQALTSREMDVLSLMANGDCNKTIARTLGVTVGTVKTHVRAVMCKLDSRSRTEAVLNACRLGLVGLQQMSVCR